MMNKIDIKNVYKIFGHKTAAALALSRQGKPSRKCRRKPAA